MCTRSKWLYMKLNRTVKESLRNLHSWNSYGHSLVRVNHRHPLASNIFVLSSLVESQKTDTVELRLVGLEYIESYYTFFFILPEILRNIFFFETVRPFNFFFHYNLLIFRKISKISQIVLGRIQFAKIQVFNACFYILIKKFRKLRRNKSKKQKCMISSSRNMIFFFKQKAIYFNTSYTISVLYCKSL